MPRGDRTGPFGEGPKTGRQMGYCTGHDSPGFVNIHPNWKFRPGRRLGRGFGWGIGRGPGSGFRGGFGPGFIHGYGRMYEDIPEVSEKTMIENEIRILKDQLSSLEDRLSKLGEE
ncbi:MAG: hypothetical protein AMS26_05005 [Bacteroides sp. SM23_62]|nr:MAG: hypothetical protein AMS26_05005 [Bacteroides sp. SM23_62]